MTEQTSVGAPSRGRLERFRKAKEQELVRLAAGPMPGPFGGSRPSFSAALARGAGRLPAVIAEYKRASPSRGVICEIVSVESAVTAYAEGGASALSILTEEQYFRGSLAFLGQARAALDAAGFADLPLLRKDFLFDPLQVEATAATPASAFLLIVRQTPDAQLLRTLRKLGERFGMEAVVEIFDSEDLELARQSGASILQVNARDLETFRVDRKACLALAGSNGPRKGELWIAASGMDAHGHLLEAGRAGYSAALVGSALMEGGRLRENLARLLRD